MKLGKSVGNSIKKEVDYLAWNSVYSSVWNSIDASVRSSVRNSVENSVWDSVVILTNNIRNEIR